MDITITRVTIRERLAITDQPAPVIASSPDASAKCPACREELAWNRNGSWCMACGWSRSASPSEWSPVLDRAQQAAAGELLPIVIGGRTRYRPACTLDGCTNPIGILSAQLCRSHYYRQKRWGDPRIAPARGRPNPPKGADHPSHKPVVGYSAAHYRIRSLKGSAGEHPCVDCGQQAQSWSYDGEDLEALTDQDNGFAYSLDPDHYEARCARCHRAYDSPRSGGRRSRAA